ncbi:hypothetical protein [Kineococcus sp. SYSU DK018]|uniref:hypothetical protein n=1 Tax=Kineococcus sp. SYSU DK018 TaxID=3383139 RepID=UPI003D7E81A4
MNLLLLLALASLPAGCIVVLVAFVFAVSTAPRRLKAILPALAGAVLTTVWIAVTYQGGIRADETGTSESVFSDAGWLAAGVALSVVSLVLNARHRRPHAAPASSST